MGFVPLPQRRQADGISLPQPSDARISTTISFARIVLIIGLVFLHYRAFPDSQGSPFDGMDVRNNPLATFVDSFVLFFFFSVVPLLSVISGWLFFNLPEVRPESTLRHRIQRRFTSLYLPLVFWNAMFLGVLALLHAWRPDSALFGQINIAFDHARLLDYVNAVFAITRHPVGFQFWFVRDLFVTALVSPVLWLALKRAQWIGLAVLAAAWISGSHLLVFFRTDVVLFFYIGGMLRINRAPLWIGARTTCVLMTAYIALAAMRAAAPALIDMPLHQPEWLVVATRAMRLVGVPACWGAFLLLAQRPLGTRIARYGGLAFFLHAAHFPLLAVIKLMLWQWLPARTNAWLLLHYLASVTVTVVIGISAGLLLVRFAPKAFALMNGGRLIPAAAAPVRGGPARRPLSGSASDAF